MMFCTVNDTEPTFSECFQLCQFSVLYAYLRQHQQTTPAEQSEPHPAREKEEAKKLNDNRGVGADLMNSLVV